MPRPKKKTLDSSKKTGREQAPVAKIKGMKDILPDEYKYWHLVNRKASELAKLYNFKRIDLPTLESVALYERVLGKTSDFVSQELFTCASSDGEKIALRPDGAIGLMRAGIEHNYFSLERIFKAFWQGTIFRYDKNQGGRLRQSNQFRLDIVGDFKPSADAQLILIGYNFFKELQVDVEVEINSVGNQECRNNYTKVINEYFKERGRKSKLCADCRKKILKNPWSVLDCQEASCEEVMADLPPLVDHLTDDCRKRFEAVLEYLDGMGVPYSLNTRLVSVNGFDYYNHTIFEYVPVSEGNKSQALGGGGNYSAVMESLGAKALSVCGFGIDVEKTISRIRSKNITVACEEEADIFMAQLSENAKQKCMSLFEELRRAGFRVREFFIQDSLKLQLEEAERVKAKYALILGQKELIDETILLRDMESGVQETIDIRKILHELDKRLNIS